MIGRFGGLNGLMMATQKDLLSVKGIGKAKMAQILAAMEIVKRRLRQPRQVIIKKGHSSCACIVDGFHCFC